MNKIILHTKIDAPIKRCFDLSTSIDLHKISASKSQEQAVAGVTEGLIKLNETVTWKAKHFGIWHKMKVKITNYNRPNQFTDVMEKGTFKLMKHKHDFKTESSKTIMTDTFEFASPLGIIGKLVDKVILKNYMTDFLKERNSVIKEYAKPMVGRSVQVNSVIFKDDDWRMNKNSKARAHLLTFPNKPKEQQVNGARNYIEFGEDLEIHKGYKNRIRENWYVVPSLKISDALFIRRNNIYPRLIVNEANAYTTDTMHRVFLFKTTNLNSFTASYYNSLSLAFTEVCGRSHGGGVLELMPNEAERVLLPYHEDNYQLLESIDSMVRDKRNIEQILDITDKIILKKNFNLTKNEISTARKVWKRLSSRRLNRGK